MNNKDLSEASGCQVHANIGGMCVDLALEGERLCNSGDRRAGVAFFLEALQAGTDDQKILCIIYSQLGNAYFNLGDYHRAIQYHKHELTLASKLGDKLEIGKASGNLGNALKVMGNFDEATKCLKRQLELSRELNHKLNEGKALNNLGNVYLAKGKHIGQIGQEHKDPAEFSEEVKNCLKQAIDYYTKNLEIVKELGDVTAQGRAFENLGNTNYLLGNFDEAVMYHKQRLKIARRFRDKAAKRRAHSNLGNSYIFLNYYEKAVKHYKQMLYLAREQEDNFFERQALYCLGNTYTLLHDYTLAIENYGLLYRIAQNVNDRVAECRACWSLGNIYLTLRDNALALRFNEEHFGVSRKLGDLIQQTAAYENIVEARRRFGLRLSGWTPKDFIPLSNNLETSTSMENRVKRRSMEELDLIKFTSDSERDFHVRNIIVATNNMQSLKIEYAPQEEND